MVKYSFRWFNSFNGCFLSSYHIQYYWLMTDRRRSLLAVVFLPLILLVQSRLEDNLVLLSLVQRIVCAPTRDLKLPWVFYPCGLLFTCLKTITCCLGLGSSLSHTRIQLSIAFLIKLLSLLNSSLGVANEASWWWLLSMSLMYSAMKSLFLIPNILEPDFFANFLPLLCSSYYFWKLWYCSSCGEWYSKYDGSDDGMMTSCVLTHFLCSIAVPTIIAVGVLMLD